MSNSDHARLFPPLSLFRAVAFAYIEYEVVDPETSSEFYRNLLNISAAGAVGDTGAPFGFGHPRRRLLIRKGQTGASAPRVASFGISVEGVEPEEIRAMLVAHGFDPLPGPLESWVVSDPFGFSVAVAAVQQSEAVDAAPSGTFQASAFNHLAYHVDDYAVARDFYLDVFGMRLAFEDGRKCSVAFGGPEDAIYINRLSLPSKGSHVDHLAFSIPSFDLAQVRRILVERGLNPEPDGNFAWTVRDPDGFRIQICAEIGVYPGAARDPFHEP